MVKRLMERNIKYSIVIPVYNAEHYIDEMINSILHQSYENWELIIIDDGSTDNSGKICDNYEDERVFVYHYENQGQMIARKTGIMKAQGEYTLVVDADDKLDEDCLLRINEILKQNEYDMVMFPYMLFDSNLKKMTGESAPPSRKGILSQKEILKWVISTYNHGLVDKMIRTDLLKKGSVEATNRSVKVNGDYALIIPVICNINNGYYFDKAMYYYRVYDKSISHNYCFQHIIDTDYVTTEINKVLKNHELLDDDVQISIYRAYLDMILWMLEEVIIKRRISYKEFGSIKNLEIFQDVWKIRRRLNKDAFKAIELWAINMKNSFVGCTVIIRTLLFMRHLKRNILDIAKMYIKMKK